MWLLISLCQNVAFAFLSEHPPLKEKLLCFVNNLQQAPLKGDLLNQSRRRNNLPNSPALSLRRNSSTKMDLIGAVKMLDISWGRGERKDHREAFLVLTKYFTSSDKRISMSGFSNNQEDRI